MGIMFLIKLCALCIDDIRQIIESDVGETQNVVECDVGSVWSVVESNCCIIRIDGEFWYCTE